MNKMRVILIAAIALVVMACTQQKTVDYTLISGKVENFKSKGLALFTQLGEEKTIFISEDGTFADTIFNEDRYFLRYGKNYAFLYSVNGAELFITFDANNFNETLNISGKKSGISQYLTGKEGYIKQVRFDFERYKKNEADFMAANQQDHEYLTAALEKHEDIPEKIKNLELRALDLYIPNILLNYCIGKSQKPEDKLYVPGEELSKQITNLDLNDEELRDYSRLEYNGFIRNYIFYNALKMVKRGEESSLDIASLILHENIENESIREPLLHDLMVMSLPRADNREELYNKYMSLAKNEKFRAAITTHYKSADMMKAGNPAPKFFDFENHKGGTTSLDDFKGKYVYIDIWATWCGPCRKEIPHLQKVEEKYHGKNIEFVSISTDKQSSKDAWRKMVSEKQMGGVQLIASKDTKFMNECGVSGIPRFILIDPDGNIVKANAPRPSDKKLIELFNELGL